MAEQTTYPCLVCRSPADRVDSGTVWQAWDGNRFTTQRERIVFCALCQTRRFQLVSITVQDGGETDATYIKTALKRDAGGFNGKPPKEEEP